MVISIENWMTNELSLKGNELLIYALIYSHSYDGVNVYIENRESIAENLNIDPKTVRDILNRLKDAQLITRDSVIFNDCEIVICKATKTMKREFPVKKDTIKNFVPPTISEIREYCKERNNNIDPEQFFNFYSSKGWMIGKNKMKNWRMAINTWEKNTKTNVKTTTSVNKEYRTYRTK